ncbi:peptidase M50 [Solwaraspora sp. WMMB335]|uniref:peptidase M50 n=1 Tax=Solwaraspora sp. WMMB335 TaxID=3404118 RepID=UPI003B93ACEC
MTSGPLLAKRLRLHPDVLVSRRLMRGPAQIHLVKDMRTGRAFEVSAREHFIMTRLDGRRSLAEIGEEYARAFRRRLVEAHWQQLLGLLYRRGLLDDPSTTGPSTSGPSTAVSGRATPSRASLALVEWVHRRTRWLLSAPVALSLLVLVVALGATVAVRIDEAVTGLRWFADHPLWLLPVALLAWASAALHELAHGVTARHFGCAVTAVSMVTLRCRVDGYLYLSSPRAQIAIAAAGGFANGLLMLPIGLVWLVLPSSVSIRPALAAILLIGYVQALVNVIPLPPLDGYKIISHAFGVTRLFTGTRQFLWHLVRGLVDRRDPGALAYPTRARLCYLSYGLICLILVVAASSAAVLLGRRLSDGPVGSAGTVITVVVVVMTASGWLARPRRRPAAPDATDVP